MKYLMILFLLMSNMAYSAEIDLSQLSAEEYDALCYETEEYLNPDSICYMPPSSVKIGVDGIEITKDDNFATVLLAAILILLLYFAKLELDFRYYKKRKEMDKDEDG